MFSHHVDRFVDKVEEIDMEDLRAQFYMMHAPHMKAKAGKPSTAASLNTRKQAKQSKAHPLPRLPSINSPILCKEMQCNEKEHDARRRRVERARGVYQINATNSHPTHPPFLGFVFRSTKHMSHPNRRHTHSQTTHRFTPYHAVMP